MAAGRSALLIGVPLLLASAFVWVRASEGVDRGVPPPSAPTSVLVELFTSEGCSSCPPADAVLSRLAGDRSMSNITVLALGEHVDYWDRLGWRDPFSSPAFTKRQGEYQAQAFKTSSVYTPQIVVDGQWEGVGSDEPRVAQAIRKAAVAPHARVRLGIDWPAGSRVLRVSVDAEVPPAVPLGERADLIVAVAEDRLTSHVKAGENHDRTLAHSAVVRLMKAAASVTPRDRTVSTTVSLDTSSDWKRPDLRIVAFLQARDSRRVLGAAAAAP